MRIVFLCGSLEPGKDGVGDYTRLLAAELVRRDHCCLLIALNDRWRSESVESVSGEFRFDAVHSWPERMELARQVLERFQPDVISLQFVPYAFHDKGLADGFARRFPDLLTIRGKGVGKVHIMCHELWLGGRTSLPLRQRLIGRVQRRAILKMLRGLSPDTLVHTSNVHYRNRLRRGGIREVRILPLFGNVPIASGAGEGHEWLFSRLRETGIEINSGTRAGFLIGGFFGSLQPVDWAAEPLLGCLIRAAERSSRRLVLLSAGRIGQAGAGEWDRLATRYSGLIDFVRLGEMDSTQLSQYLTLLDFGLSSTRLSVIGKSGTVTAMLEHGLPVVCSYTDLPIEAGVGAEEDARAEALLFRTDAPNFEAQVVAGLPRLEPMPRLCEIASRMLDDLRDTDRGAMAQ